MLVIPRRTGVKVYRNKSEKTMIKVVEVLPKAKALDKLERARMFAYSLYEKRGGALGNKSQGWLNAETNAEKIKESQEK